MDDRELSLKGYSRVRRDRCIGIHGGMAAFIKSSLSYETLADPMSGEEQLELLAFKVNGPRHTQLDVILVYSQSLYLDTILIEKLQKVMPTKTLLLIADINALNVNWSDMTTSGHDASC